MHRFIHRIRRTTALCTSLIAVGLLAACASHTPLPALEQARSAVSAAAGDPVVTQYAQVELKDACRRYFAKVASTRVNNIEAPATDE